MKSNPRFKLYKSFLPDLGHEKALELACKIEGDKGNIKYHPLYPLIALRNTKERKEAGM